MGQQSSSHQTCLHHQTAWTKPVTKTSTEVQIPNPRFLPGSCSHKPAPFCSPWLQTEMQHWTVHLNWPLLRGFGTKVCKTASKRFPPRASVGRKAEASRTCKHTGRKGAPCSWHWGLNRVVQSPSGSSQQFWIPYWGSEQTCRPHPHRRRKQGESFAGSHLYLSSRRWMKETPKFHSRQWGGTAAFQGFRETIFTETVR